MEIPFLVSTQLPFFPSGLDGLDGLDGQKLAIYRMYNERF
jgi:hypothetical protein